MFSARLGHTDFISSRGRQNCGVGPVTRAGIGGSGPAHFRAPGILPEYTRRLKPGQLPDDKAGSREANQR